MISTPRMPLQQIQNSSQSFPSPIRKRMSVLNASQDVEENAENDEDERTTRRNMAMQKRNSNVVNMSDGGRQVPAEEMKMHLQVCFKMFAENKITIKNAWNLNVIDYIKYTLANSNKPRETLQVASTSLDVGAKVYSIRVDDIHSDGLKLASNMSRVAAEEKATDENEDELEEGNTSRRKEPLRKKRRLNRSTIAKDRSAVVDTKLNKLESVFFQTQSESSLSLVENLFTHRMPTDASNCRFMLLSEDKVFDNKDGIYEEEQKEYSCQIEPLNHYEICLEFEHFKIDEWDCDNDHDFMQPNASQSLLLDDNGLPMAQLDGSIHDIFAEPDHNNSSDDENNADNMFQEVITTTSFRPVDITNDKVSEFSFRDTLQSNKLLSQLWAGPSHWKLKYLRQANSRFSGQEKKIGQTKTKKTKQEDPFVDFDELQRLVDEKKVKYKPTGKKTNIYSEDVKYSLAIDNVVMTNIFDQLLTKPVYIERKTKADNIEPSQHNDEGPSDLYNYENPSDSQYCPENVNDDHHQSDDEIIVAQHQDNEEYIVNMESQKPQILYATMAKKMDMKKLKAAIWKKVEPEDELLFSVLYKALPNCLNSSMAKELSCHLAFFAVLHLGNEHNLKLLGSKDRNDFAIRKS